MALKTRTYKVDDLDESIEEGVETIQIALDGQAYELDLGPTNAERLRDKLQRFVDAATPVKTKAAPARRGKTAAVASNRQAVQDIRDWAEAAGLEVSKRGRVSQVVKEAYDAAH